MSKLSLALSRFTSTTRLGISASAGIAVFGGYFLIFHLSLSSDLEQAENKHSSLKRQLGEAKAAEQAYREDLAALADKEARQKEYNKVLPATTEYPAFLSSVQAAANVSGVSLAAWTPTKEVPEEFYARVPMRLELTGRFHQIARFFYNVGQLDRIINMENISLSAPATPPVGNEVILTTNALATAFHIIEQEEAADGKQERRKRGKQGE